MEKNVASQNEIIAKLRSQLAIAEAATARARAEVAAHEAAWARLASTAHVLRRGESGAHQSLDEFESGLVEENDALGVLCSTHFTSQ